MDIKKSLLLLLTFVMVFSCKQDEILDQNTGDADLSADISIYDNSNLGLYKGTFTTLDAAERGVVEVKVLDNYPSKATITLVSGAIYTLKSVAVSANQDVTNLKFTDATDTANAETVNMVSFDLSVNSDGSSPSITNVTLGNKASDILILKETSRGPVVTVNGTWICDTDCLPNMMGVNQTFNIAGTAGAVLTLQLTLNGTTFFGSATQGNATVHGDFETATIVGTAQVPQSPGNPDTNINFTMSHRWRTASPDCSTLKGVWDYESPSQPGVPSTGTVTSDTITPNCPPQGDSPSDAIVFPIVSAGNCVVDNTFIELVTGGFTASNLASSCATLANKDIFYTWTATTDAFTIKAGTGANGTNPQVTVYDFTGGVPGAEIECTRGSNLGSVTASGWSVSDELLVRVSASRNIGVCFEESTLPVSISANDLCSNAIAISCGDTVMGNTLNDNSEHNPGPLFRDAGNDVYYRYTAGILSESVTVSLCGSSFDTTLYIYDDGCSLVSEVSFGDDECGGQSETTFTSMPSAIYTIVVDGYGEGASGTGAKGAFTLGVTCVPIALFGCGSNIVDDGGTPGEYSNSQFVTYEIGSIDPTLVPTLTFTEFDLESDAFGDWDFMRFFDGPDTSSPEIVTSDLGATAILGVGFSGTVLDGDSVTATQRFLTVTFDADNINFEYYEGYDADVTCAIPFAGGSTGLQGKTIVNSRKAKAPTRAQIVDKRARAKEIKLRGNK